MKKATFVSLSKSLTVTTCMVLGAKIPYELLGTTGTFQTFFLLLTALYFTPREVGLGQLGYLIAGFFFPVFSSTYYGKTVLLGDSAGYIYMFLPAAVLAARIFQNEMDGFARFSWAMVIHVLILMGGFAWITLYRGSDPGIVFFSGIIVLLPGAFMKSALAWIIHFAGEKWVKPRIKR